MESTTSRATNSSASNCNVQRPKPAGGFPNRMAISFAFANAIELRLSRRVLTLAAIEGQFKAVKDNSLTQVLNGLNSTTERVSNSGTSPCRPIGVRLQKDCARRTFCDVPLSFFTTSWYV
jgi:hypothetical protein